MLTGAVMPFAMSSAPSGWLKANGAAISRTAYAALFALIGTTYGAGNGSTTFNVPDFRGEFVRGWDDGRGVDSGRGFATTQYGQIESHTHGATAAASGYHSHTASSGAAGAHSHWFGLSRELFVRGTDAGYGDQEMSGANLFSTNTEAAHTHTITVNADGSHAHTLTIAPTGGSETRPRNLSLLMCIKY